jgi:hypothetical protein
MTLYATADAINSMNAGGWIITASDIPFKNMVVPFTADDNHFLVQLMRVPHLYHVSKKP